MSSPVHHVKDLDVALTYAPPWARDHAEPMPALPAAPTIERPPPSRRPGNAGDRAVLELRRQLALDPEKIPEPPLARDQSGGSIALRICALIGAAALVAWAVVALPGTKHAAVDKAQADFPVTPTATDSGKPYQSSLLATPWLSVHDVQGEVNKPLPAGIQLEGDAVGGTITLSGLAADTRLSAGQPSGTTAWRVGAGDLDGLTIQPPQAFVGAMDVTVELRLADGRTADSQVVHFAWLGPAGTSAAPPPATEPPQRQSSLVLDGEEIATLVKRGKDLLENGDLASARLLLRRAAEAGSASGALALGATFDPAVIRKLGAVGAQPDPTRARKWYQKAADLGSPVASQQLEKLAQAPQ